MVTFAEGIRLAGAALGAIGGALVALEFFQVPTYVRFNEDFGGYDIDIAPDEVREHTNLGRAGGLLVSLGFALLFLGELL